MAANDRDADFKENSDLVPEAKDPLCDMEVIPGKDKRLRYLM
jgi:hypothetical protein